MPLQVAHGGVRSATQRHAKLRGVEELALDVRKQRPEPTQRLRSHAHAHPGQVALQNGAEEILAPRVGRFVVHGQMA